MSRRRFLVAGALLSLVFVVPRQVRATEWDPDLPTLYEPYAQLLEEYLVELDLDDGGLVSAFSYREAMAHPRTAERLADQRARLRAFDPGRITERTEAIAFWLNAYNFFMLEHILENPRHNRLVASVRDYGSLINPYRVFRQELFDIGGKKFSLDDMQKDILLGAEFTERGWFDARVHFAVNCASVGCPPLRTQLYTADNVDSLLEDNTRRALKTARHMRIDGDTLRLSQLFQWYAADYERDYGSVRAFLRAHTPEALHPHIDGASRIRYINYDWSLNEPASFPEFN